MDIINILFLISIGLLIVSAILMLVGLIGDKKILVFISLGVFICFGISIYGVWWMTKNNA